MKCSLNYGKGYADGKREYRRYGNSGYSLITETDYAKGFTAGFEYASRHKDEPNTDSPVYYIRKPTQPYSA